MFIDTAKINVKAGDGGQGCNSLYRDKWNRKGTPDGGDGGNGGDVILRVSTGVHTLLDFRYRQIFKAKKGGNGSSKQKRGRDGDDLIIKVPAGTLIFENEKKRLLKDLVSEGDEFLVAKGGGGGKGNRSRKLATLPQEGESINLFLELKLIADIGIIGLPNAGKSTLLSCISKAHPRIASFPFTTKNPALGVVEYDDITFKVCEIPGLIENSHQGKGLGHKFLRHAERTKFYLHLIDISKSDIDEIVSDYEMLNRELNMYSKDFSRKEQIIAGSKIDIEGAKENLRILKKRLNKDIIGISAKDGLGTEELVKKLAKNV
ncbi:Obg family GTPase CgtA [Candidatus Omnitrophota bacterium]